MRGARRALTGTLPIKVRQKKEGEGPGGRGRGPAGRGSPFSETRAAIFASNFDLCTPFRPDSARIGPKVARNRRKTGGNRRNRVHKLKFEAKMAPPISFWRFLCATCPLARLAQRSTPAAARPAPTRQPRQPAPPFSLFFCRPLLGNSLVDARHTAPARPPPTARPPPASPARPSPARVARPPTATAAPSARHAQRSGFAWGVLWPSPGVCPGSGGETAGSSPSFLGCSFWATQAAATDRCQVGPRQAFGRSWRSAGRA